MTRIQKTALLAFLLLLVVAAVGTYLGGGKARAADAQPATVVLDSEHLTSIRLLPPERRQVLQPSRFLAPPVNHPLQAGGGRVAGGKVAALPPTDDAASAISGGSAAAGKIPVNLAEAGYRKIRVRQGEVLSRIAKRELGNADRWREILKLNGLETDRDVLAGQLLYLPPVDQAVSSDANLQPSDKSDSGASSKGPTIASTYRVQRGDILGRIAYRYYGSAQEAVRILEANGLTDANQIRTGQELVIPARGPQ